VPKAIAAATVAEIINFFMGKTPVGLGYGRNINELLLQLRFSSAKTCVSHLTPQNMAFPNIQVIK
jgi:hypothetical protein